MFFIRIKYFWNELQEEEVAIGTIPFAILTRGTWDAYLGEYAVVIWWLLCRIRSNSLMTLSLKWDPWSLAYIKNMQNFEYHSSEPTKWSAAESRIEGAVCWTWAASEYKESRNEELGSVKWRVWD